MAIPQEVRRGLSPVSLEVKHQATDPEGPNPFVRTSITIPAHRLPFQLDIFQPHPSGKGWFQSPIWSFAWAGNLSRRKIMKSFKKMGEQYGLVKNIAYFDPRRERAVNLNRWPGFSHRIPRRFSSLKVDFQGGVSLSWAGKAIGGHDEFYLSAPAKTPLNSKGIKNLLEVTTKKQRLHTVGDVLRSLEKARAENVALTR